MNNDQHPLLGALGLCRKAGKLLHGYDRVQENALRGKVALVLLTSDASERTVSHMKDACDGIVACEQMHGLVVLDKNDTVIRPCILWNDGRTQRQVDYLNGVIGKDKLSRYTANIAFAGFTAPKLLWMRENEPDNFARIEKIMLPKDYINYKLTGVHCTDYSDASGMLLLDVSSELFQSNQVCVFE